MCAVQTINVIIIAISVGAIVLALGLMAFGLIGR